MNKDDANNVMKRLTVLWPRERTADGDVEWFRVLAPLDYKIADGALNEMRDTLMFPPSIADFRSAYYLVLQEPSDSLALPPGDEVPTNLRDLYGQNQKEWVYCWRCDMALTLTERDSSCGYDLARGMYHHVCPHNGSAPTIPAWERVKRNEYFDKKHIAFGPYVEPVPYRP